MSWHLRPIGLILTLLNAAATLDCALSRMRDPLWLGRLSLEQLRALYGLPPWAAEAWTVAVLGGLGGALALLARLRLALWAFVLYLVASLPLLLWQTIAAPAPVVSPLVLIVILAEIAYARSLKLRGALR